MRKKKENYLRRVWYNMIQRCTNASHFAYKNYGARGVLVCEEWLSGYNPFKEWALSNGWVKGLQLDKDIKGNGLLYSPDTCCFVDLRTNSKNKPSVKKYEYNGQFLDLSDISNFASVSADKLRHRMFILKMSAGQAVEDIRSNKQYKRIKMPESLQVKLLDATRKKILDEETGKVFISIREAAKFKGISEQYMGAMLNGRMKNKTKMKYAATHANLPVSS